ncbi:MAG TPA: YHS domain-containing protein [Acidobacteriota bacterium]|nr:YHS domain-containing protein [Acidobacteriota bacterium]
MKRAAFITALVVMMGLIVAGCAPATQEEAAETAPQVEQAEIEQADEVAVKDLVCGMTVDPEAATAITFEHEEETYYFCSEPCLERFKADPVAYVRAAGYTVPGQ